MAEGSISHYQGGGARGLQEMCGTQRRDHCSWLWDNDSETVDTVLAHTLLQNTKLRFPT